MTELPSPAASTLWQIGSCIADLQRQLLLRDGLAVAIRPKAWLMLTHLLARPHALVSSAELLDALWPRQQVDPKNLVNLASQLRNALGDKQVLRSVHRRGYVLDATPASRPETEVAVDPSALRERPPEGSAPFAGRAGELAILSAYLNLAARGRIQCVQIAGPSGVGKTRLVEHWLQHAHPVASWQVLKARCTEVTGEREPFGPWMQILQEATRHAEPQAWTDELRRLAPCWLTQLPALLDEQSLRELRYQTYRAGTGRMVRECAALVQAMARRQPLLLVLEDIQWLDTASLDLLITLLRSRADAAILLVMTRRQERLDEPAAPIMEVLQRTLADEGARFLTLSGLNAAEVAQYLDFRSPGVKDHAAMSAGLLALTEGLPILLGLVVDELLASGIPATQWFGTVTRFRDLQRPVRQLVLSRAGSLSLRRRSVLDMACCVAMPIPVPMTAQVLELTETEVEAACEALVRLGLFESAPSLVPWGEHRLVRCYGFAHPIYRETFHAELGRELLCALNKRIAQVLQSNAASRNLSFDMHLAASLSGAQQHEEAAAALRLSSMRCLSRFAHRHAVRAMQEALQQLEYLPDRDEQRQQRLEVCWDLSRLLPFEQGECSAEMLALRRRIQVLGAQLGTPRAQFIVQATGCSGGIHAGRVDMARQPLARLLQVAAGMGTHERALAELWRGIVGMADGNFDESEQAFKTCLALPLNDLGLLGFDVQNIALSQFAWTQAVSGQLDAYAQTTARLVDQVGRSRNPYLRCLALYWTAEPLRLLGCGDAARANYEELLQLSAEHDSRLFEIEAQIGLQYCKTPAQRDLYALRNRLAGDSGRGPTWSDYKLLLLEVQTHVACGELTDAASALRGLHDLQSRWPFSLSEKLRREGDLAAALAQPDEADRLWRQALNLDVKRAYLPGILQHLQTQQRLPEQRRYFGDALAPCLALSRFVGARLESRELQPLQAVRDQVSQLLLTVQGAEHGPARWHGEPS